MRSLSLSLLIALLLCHSTGAKRQTYPPRGSGYGGIFLNRFQVSDIQDGPTPRGPRVKASHPPWQGRKRSGAQRGGPGGGGQPRPVVHHPRRARGAHHTAVREPRWPFKVTLDRDLGLSAPEVAATDLHVAHDRLGLRHPHVVALLLVLRRSSPQSRTCLGAEAVSGQLPTGLGPDLPVDGPSAAVWGPKSVVNVEFTAVQTPPRWTASSRPPCRSVPRNSHEIHGGTSQARISGRRCSSSGRIRVVGAATGMSSPGCARPTASSSHPAGRPRGPFEVRKPYGSKATATRRSSPAACAPLVCHGRHESLTSLPRKAACARTPTSSACACPRRRSEQVEGLFIYSCFQCFCLFHPIYGIASRIIYINLYI